MERFQGFHGFYEAQASWEDHWKLCLYDIRKKNVI